MPAHSLEKRSMLLKLLSMNLFAIEVNSRPECLVDFKRAYGASIEAAPGDVGSRAVFRVHERL